MKRSSPTRFRAARWVIPVLAAALGCHSLDPRPASPDALPDADGATSDVGLAAAEVVPENCRVWGYGIGPAESPHCLTGHLMAHAANVCHENDGEVTAQWSRPRSCAAEAGEVQVLCCFSDAPPVLADLRVTLLSPLDRVIDSVPATSPGPTLHQAATDACRSDAGNLGDWHIVYADRGEAASAIRFRCRAENPPPGPP